MTDLIVTPHAFALGTANNDPAGCARCPFNWDADLHNPTRWAHPTRRIEGQPGGGSAEYHEEAREGVPEGLTVIAPAETAGSALPGDGATLGGFFNPERAQGEQVLADFLNPELSVEDLVGDRRTQMEALLREWWINLAEDEVGKVAPKAVEYGALDLIDIGRDLARTAGREINDEEAAEMGIYFYIRGKLARWTDALVRNDRPSDDTLHDLGVYVRMAQRVRAVGGWPGV